MGSLHPEKTPEVPYAWNPSISQAPCSPQTRQSPLVDLKNVPGCRGKDKVGD